MKWFYLFINVMLLCLSDVKNKNVIYQVYDNSTKEYFCLTNSSYGLIWIDDNNTTNPNPTFLPETKPYDFQPHINFTLENVTITNSLILDHQWEGIETIVTNKTIKVVSDHKECSFKQILFSLRSEEKAEMFLCEKKNINCYHIILETNQSKIQIEKCSGINLTETECRNDTLKFENINGNYTVSGKYWSHFIILFTTTIEIKNSKAETLILMRDNDIIDVNYIFVRSPNSIAFWKFHKVIVNKLSIKPNSTFLSNLPVISNHTCISFSIYTKGYAVTLYMTDSNNTNEIIKQEKFKKTEPWFEYNWINVKFYSHDIKVKSVNINISLTGEEVNFSSLRFCEKQEFRKISSTTQKRCQIISEENSINWWDNKIEKMKYNNESLDFTSLFPSAKNGTTKICEKERCFYLRLETKGKKTTNRKVLTNKQTSTSHVLSTTLTVIVVATIIIITVLLLFFLKRGIRNNRRKLKRVLTTEDLLQDFTLDDLKINFITRIKEDFLKGKLNIQYKVEILHTFNSDEIIYAQVYKNILVNKIDMIYLDDLCIKEAYLIAKYPCNQTEIIKFWLHIWEENVKNIVLVDNLNKTSEMWKFYWTDTKSEEIYLELMQYEKFHNFEIRKIKLHFKSEAREINHFRYCFSTIDSFSSFSLLNFFEKLSNIPLSAKSPVLFHSNLKVGQIGLFVICDMNLRIYNKHLKVDLPKTLKHLLNYNTSLLEDENQYILANFIILEKLLREKYYVDEDLSLSRKIDKTLERYLKYIKNIEWLDSANRDLIKNLTRSNSSDNIIRIDDFLGNQKFIITQETSKIIYQSINLIEENISAVIFFGTSFLNFEEVNILSFKNWPSDSNLPKSIEEFVDFCSQISPTINLSEKVLIVCSKLQQASLYLAINYNIKKIQTEGVSNVLTSIRRLRYYNLPVLEQEQELTFIWNATKLFIEQNRQL